MNPELQAKLNELEKQISDLKHVASVEFKQSLRLRALQDYVEAGSTENATSNENTTTVVPSGGGNVLHAAQYDKRAIVTIGGVDYYIGLYEL